MDELKIEAAVAYDSDRPFTTATLSLRAPSANELRIRIVATSVCHTDLMSKSKALCSFPIVLGHEGAGVVDALGDDVSGFEVGDHVVLSYDYCGKCPACSNDKPSYYITEDDKYGDIKGYVEPKPGYGSRKINSNKVSDTGNCVSIW